MRFVLAATAALAIAGTAQAGVVTLFSDNFDAEPAALTVTSLANWTVTGNIDIVDQANPYGIGACLGRCADLDGTTGPGEILSKPIAFGAGKPVLVSFDVSGNQRGGPDDSFLFELTFSSVLNYNLNVITGFLSGSTGFYTSAGTGTYWETIASGRPYVTYTLGFIPTTAGSLQLRMGTTSNDNIGPILDNVLVTQVPEPATWAMLIAGFGLVGFAMRRRRTLSAA